MNNLPFYISILLMLTTFLTVAIFYKAANKSNTTLLILSAWLILQTFLGLSGFYLVTDTIPPRFFLTLFPPLIFIIALFATTKGRQYIDGLNIKTLTILHAIRIPVELVIFWLFVSKTVPQLMTFEGRNFDIISGLTAPAIFYLAFVKKRIGRKLLLLWNVGCLGLLVNIVVYAIISAPFPFQQMAFDQPNIAVLHFPFVWLPCCIVPLVLFSHLAATRQLLKPGFNNNDKVSGGRQFMAVDFQRDRDKATTVKIAERNNEPAIKI